MCLSHKSLCTIGRDQYLIIIVPSLQGFHLCPPHLLRHHLCVPHSKVSFLSISCLQGPSRCCLFFHRGVRGGNYSTNGVPLFLTNGIYSCKL